MRRRGTMHTGHQLMVCVCLCVTVCVYYWGGREPKERETNMELRGAQVTTGGRCNSRAGCLLFVLIRQGLRGGSGPLRLIRAPGIETGTRSELMRLGLYARETKKK